MAVEVYTFSINVPKGGTATRPQVFNLPMRVALVDGVEIYVPPGANGQLQFALGANNTPTLPTNQGGYIIANDEVIKWPLEHQIDSGAWQLFAFNTGTVAHLIHIRFLLTPPGLADIVSGPGIIDNLTIQFPSDGGSGGGGGGGGGGGAYSFSLETPLPALQVVQGAAATATVLVDEIGTRPGPYTLTVSGAPSGISVSTPTPSTPTALPVAVVVAASVPLGSYALAVTVTNAGITQTAQLPVSVVAAGTGGGGGGGTPATITLSNGTIVQGGTLTYYGANWIAGEGVTLSLGVTQWVIAADARGVISGAVTLPASLPPGYYQFMAIGTQHSAAGPTVQVTAPVVQNPFVVVVLNNGVQNIPRNADVIFRVQGGLAYAVYQINTPTHVLLETLNTDGSGNAQGRTWSAFLSTYPAGLYTAYGFNNYQIQQTLTVTLGVA